MSTADYSVHLKGSDFDALWEAEAGEFPYGEDAEEIDRILAEELPSVRRRVKKKKSQR